MDTEEIAEVVPDIWRRIYPEMSEDDLKWAWFNANAHWRRLGKGGYPSFACVQYFMKLMQPARS